MTTPVQPMTAIASLSDEELVSRVSAVFTAIDNSIHENTPYILELRKRFREAPQGRADIDGCQTWEEFCKKRLHRAPVTIRQAIQEFKEEAAGIQTSCEFCGEVFPSKKQKRKHVGKKHPEHLPQDAQKHIAERAEQERLGREAAEKEREEREAYIRNAAKTKREEETQPAPEDGWQKVAAANEEEKPAPTPTTTKEEENEENTLG